jgi:GDP/UDP-N,N'-diacetylbacillosamine 2-epimerase (hydrolysing)
MIKKITVTTGTRSEYGLLRPVLKKILESPHLKLSLIVTGMHLDKKYGLTVKEIKNDGFDTFTKIDMLPVGNSSFFMAQALGKGVISFSKIFKKLRPDLNLILGDRDEALASALAASHMNIPNAHIHGGDKSKAGMDEYNRHAITKLSNIHFAATKKSRTRIIKMGEIPKFVTFTGSPGIDDVLKNKITSKKLLEKKYDINFTGEEILLLQHPVTTQINLSNIQISNTLRAIVKTKKPVIVISPNSDAGNYAIFNQIKLFSQKYDFIKLYPSIPRNDYLGFLKNCGVLVGNSSSGIIEASYFSIPVVNIGIRQQDRETGPNVINVKDGTEKSIQLAIMKSLKQKRNKISAKKYIYGDGTASDKIVNFLINLKINDELIQKQISY